MEGKPQAGGPDYPRRQLAVSAAAEVCVDYRFPSQPSRIPQSGWDDGTDRPGSVVASRHHLYQAGDGVRLSGGGAGRLFAPGDWLGVGPYYPLWKTIWR